MTRASGETVGLYPIYLGTLTYGFDYSISYTGDNFEIRRKPIIVTVNGTQVYGSSSKSFTPSYAGVPGWEVTAPVS